MYIKLFGICKTLFLIHNLEKLNGEFEIGKSMESTSFELYT